MKVSVIVPIYGVEKFLDRCVRSIVNQDFNDFEIILVDDGSPDRCGEMCDEWAQKDDRIHVIHKPNGGLSDARNCGTQAAQGDFVTYIDSDDYVAPPFLSVLYDLAAANHADMACCGNVRTSDDTADFSSAIDLPPPAVVDGAGACSAMLSTSDYALLVAWAKLIRKEIALRYPFPVGRVHEDVATTYKYFLACDRVAITDARLYAYFINTQGIQLGAWTEKRIDDALWASFSRAADLESLGEKELARLAWKNAAVFLSGIVAKSPSGGKRWMSYYRTAMRHKDVPAGLKIKNFISMHCPVFYQFLKRIKKSVGGVSA